MPSTGGDRQAVVNLDIFAERMGFDQDHGYWQGASIYRARKPAIGEHVWNLDVERVTDQFSTDPFVVFGSSVYLSSRTRPASDTHR